MPEEVKYECPECGASVAENETKCPGCGAVFEESGDGGAGEPGAAIVTAEKADDDGGEPVKEAEKVEDGSAEPVKEAERPGTRGDDEAGKKKNAREDAPDEKEEPPAQEPGKAGLNKAGIAVSALGAIGVVGAALLDPLMNLLDSKHPSDIGIGPTQMLGVAAAAILLVVGIVVTFAFRKKGR